MEGVCDERVSVVAEATAAGVDESSAAESSGFGVVVSTKDAESGDEDVRARAVLEASLELPVKRQVLTSPGPTAAWTETADCSRRTTMTQRVVQLRLEGCGKAPMTIGRVSEERKRRRKGRGMKCKEKRRSEGDKREMVEMER